MTISQTVWLGHDNVMDLQLLEQRVAVDLTDVTRMMIHVGDTAIDSDTDPGMFDWAVGDGVCRFTLGMATIPPGTYENCRIEVWDPARPNGIVWSEDLTLDVRAQET